jgi:hypothetical protein
VQRRLRDLPSRAGVYFVLALGMFPQLGYLRVWGKLTSGLAALGLPRPSEKALRDLRRRLVPAPLKALFEIVAGPLAQPYTPGVRFGGFGVWGRRARSGGIWVRWSLNWSWFAAPPDQGRFSHGNPNHPDDTMTLEIDNRVVATARFSEHAAAEC